MESPLAKYVYGLRRQQLTIGRYGKYVYAGYVSHGPSEPGGFQIAHAEHSTSLAEMKSLRLLTEFLKFRWDAHN